MARGIEVVKSVGQYAHRVVANAECCPVGTDVDTVGQSADDEYLGAKLVQARHETTDEILAVGGAMARAHDVDDASPVQVG